MFAYNLLSAKIRALRSDKVPCRMVSIKKSCKLKNIYLLLHYDCLWFLYLLGIISYSGFFFSTERNKFKKKNVQDGHILIHTT